MSAPAEPDNPFVAVEAGQLTTCGLTTEGEVYCWGARMNRGFTGPSGPIPFDSIPVRVSTDIRFQSLAVGSNHACGIATDERAYCWGSNSRWRLGSPASSDVPVAVSGDLRFRSVSAGVYHTCGVTPQGRAYCWGSNQYGQLGTGTTSFAGESTPTPVAGGLSFRMVSAGDVHTCGIVEDGRAYCWGDNTRYNKSIRDQGMLGTGEKDSSLVPAPVAGGLAFRSIDVGFSHTCAVTPGSRAYCWGGNTAGQLGDSTRVSRLAPVAVGGGLTFREIDAPVSTYVPDRAVYDNPDTYGLTTGGQIYRWGGDLDVPNTPEDRIHPEQWVPTSQVSDTRFETVTAGSHHQCGIIRGRGAFCWGSGVYGQLGAGAPKSSASPLPVKTPE